MKARILVSLFALPFFGVGVWMLWSISATLYEAQQMRAWVPVEARVLSAGYRTSSGSDSDTYEAYAEYRYSYGGAFLTGSRVTIGSGGDNIGDYQTQMADDINEFLDWVESRQAAPESARPQSKPGKTEMTPTNA